MQPSESKFPVTGIGSLPFEDEPAAFDFVRRHCPALPFVPQLPRRGRLYEMLYEPFQGFPEVIGGGGEWTLEKGVLEEMRARIRTDCRARESVERFEGEFPPVRAPNVKCQLVGPYTFLTQLRYVGSALIDERETRRFGAELLTECIERELALLSPDREQTIYVLDEPCLAFLKKKHVLGGAGVFRDLVQTIRNGGGVPAIHCCAPLPGEAAAALLRELDVDIISLGFTPERDFAETVSTDFLRAHLDGGRKVLWGIVPTRGAISAERIALWFRSECEKLGGSVENVLSGGALSAECGTGLLSIERTEEIFERTAEVRKLLGF